MKNFKRVLSLLLSLMLVLGAVAVGGMSVSADNILPNVDVTYTSENDWEGTLVIDESKTVKISGITHENTDSYGSPIKICGNSTVNLVFEGNNVLTGNSSFVSAGIEVEAGSTVNIYAEDGASLTVTGGKNSAGIGGIGYDSAGVTNLPAGNINIYGGRIIATGGSKGAAIGSGHHSSASDINIKGGDITAFGNGCGAGIGTGYASSGGAISSGAGIGFYNGGNITISGGRVRAAGCRIDFDAFDVFDSETYYTGNYDNTFAAGIGGGYGASSGNIVIEGNADVTAFGSCGAAGIGTGRGTASANKYDSDNFNCSVIIRDNANVVAAAGADHRENYIGSDSGAAIGLGRGCTLEGEPKGSVVIEGNAQVTAVAEDHAAAIGGSSVVGKYTVDSEGYINRPVPAELETLSIGSNCTVIGVTDGYRDPFTPADDLTGIIRLDVTEEFKENYHDVLADESSLIVFKGYDRDTTDEAVSPGFSLKKESVKETVELTFPKSSGIVYFSSGEYCLGNDIEERPTDFVIDPQGINNYDLSCLCNTATFVLSEDDVIPVDYPLGAETLTEPEVPQRDYYTSAWEEYELDGNITVNAVYTPIEYDAVFKADGKEAGTVKYTVETASITDAEPEVPVKENYTGKWEDYTLTPDGITVEAIYTAIEYKATFVDENGETVKEIPYTVETASITDAEPAVTEIRGYEGKWENYKLEAGGITVHPEYTLIEYTAKFVDENGETVEEIPYSVITPGITDAEPEVPFKEGNTGEWEDYTLDIGGITVKPVYTANEYTVTYVVDGNETEVTYKYGESVEKPADPVKDGYDFIGWDAEIPDTMPAENLTITALFEAIPEPEEPTPTEPTPTEPTPTEPTPTEPTSTDTEPAHEHDYKGEVTTKPTCTEDGIMTYTCECGESYTQAIPKTGHKPGAWEVVTPATTEAAGKEVRKCTVCEEVLAEREIAKLEPEETDAGIVSVNLEKTNAFGIANAFGVDPEKLPAGSTVTWYVNGEKAGEGNGFRVANPTEDYTIKAVVTNRDGKVIGETEEVTVKVKNGFFARIYYWLCKLIQKVIDLFNK